MRGREIATESARETRPRSSADWAFPCVVTPWACACAGWPIADGPTVTRFEALQSSLHARSTSSRSEYRSQARKDERAGFRSIRSLLENPGLEGSERRLRP